MPKKKNEEEEIESAESFVEKASELDFDPGGVVEEDGSQRRRDPFRQPGAAGTESDD
jgi:hypothetical protein